MTTHGLICAWIVLVLLSGLTTLASLLGLSPWITGIAILLAAWAKARLILLDYLELRHYPDWRSGLLTILGLFMAVLLGLFLAA